MLELVNKNFDSILAVFSMLLIRPILEYGAACWDPNRDGQIIALDRMEKKAAKFAFHTNSSN